MSNSIIVNGVTYSPLVSGFTGSTLAAGTYLIPHGSKLAEGPSASAPIYQELERKFPGLDGVGVVRMGFVSRILKFNLLAVAATRNAVGAARTSAETSMAQLNRYDVTWPDGTVFHGCRLTPSGLIEQFTSSYASMFCSVLSVTLRQYSLT